MSGTSLTVPGKDNELIPFSDSAPDYLAEAREKAKEYADDPFTKDDYATPKIVLLQGLSPQITLFPQEARAGHFWHTGLNISLGEKFVFVRVTAHKRVLLWRPRTDNGGGLLARSNNGVDWDIGGEQNFTVKLKDKKQPVVWHTCDNVINSGLTEFGSSDIEDKTSHPAAEVVHEYLVYIIGHPELSPAVFSLRQTSLKNAKALNMTLAGMRKGGRPYHTVAIEAFVQTKTNNAGTWTMPNFRTAGFVNKQIYDEVTEIAKIFKDYKVEYTQGGDDEIDAKVPNYQTAY